MQRDEPQHRQFSIMIPPPPRELSPNARVHRFVRNRARKEYAELVAGLIREKYPAGEIPTLTRAHGCVTFTFPDLVNRDIDNLFASLKAAIDAIVRIGVIADDGPKYIPVWTMAYVVNFDQPLPGAVDIRLVQMEGGDLIWRPRKTLSARQRKERIKQRQQQMEYVTQ